MSLATGIDVIPYAINCDLETKPLFFLTRNEAINIHWNWQSQQYL